MADWLRPTLRRRARMAQPVVAQWRDPSTTRLSASPNRASGAFLYTGCAQVPFVHRSWTLKSPAPPVVTSQPCCHRRSQPTGVEDGSLKIRDAKPEELVQPARAKKLSPRQQAAQEREAKFRKLLEASATPRRSRPLSPKRARSWAPCGRPSRRSSRATSAVPTWPRSAGSSTSRSARSRVRADLADPERSAQLNRRTTEPGFGLA
jgi:hypothetical protein